MPTMKPRSAFPASKVRNAFYGDTVLSGKVGVAHPGDIVFEKSDNACVGKLHVARSSFGSRIDHVIRMRSFREMVWVHAPGVIAMMQDLVRARYFSLVKKFERVPVRKNLTPIFRRPEKAVSASVFVSYPLPAYIVTAGRELVEKSYMSWVSFSYHFSIMGNKIEKVKGVQ